VSTFSVEIVTPIKVLNQENVSYIRCPGLDGYFGVMKKHREGVIALDVGEIKIKTDGNTEWYATSGGFAEIGSTKVELLLESIEKSNEIDVKRAAEALERAKDRKNNPQEKIDNIRLEASLTRAMNRLRISKK
jgi:F-type H+-transporting ATPase subunit epsilon|tara:strand:- start:192 stop:590 length:399 start_codon:yes stop_codon:yes gene_type:complete